MTEFDKKRQEANKEILNLLTDYIDKNPTQRFGQVIRNIGIVDTKTAENPNISELLYFTNIFNEEPQQTLVKMNRRLGESK